MPGAECWHSSVPRGQVAREPPSDPAPCLRMINFCASTAFTDTPEALILMNHVKCYAPWKGKYNPSNYELLAFFFSLSLSRSNFDCAMCCCYVAHFVNESSLVGAVVGRGGSCDAEGTLCTRLPVSLEEQKCMGGCWVLALVAQPGLWSC